MKAICIIPARGGSKRIPRKNIKNFLGKPIIAYSIEAALMSGIFAEVMVSTDDDEIAAIAKKYGAKVPFFRSKSTSNDYATTADVIIEVINWYRDKGQEFDTICCLYATAPFVSANKLIEASEIIASGEYDSAFTCSAFSYPVLRGLVIDKQGRVRMKWPEYKKSRSQDLQQFFHDAGQFYFSSTKGFQEANGFWGDNTAPIIVSELEVQDLDTPTDWTLAELKYRLMNKHGIVLDR